MSFANFDLEAQTASPKKAGLLSGIVESADSSLDSIIKNTSQQIQTYGSLVSSFNSERRLLGGRRDDTHLREKLSASQQNIVSLGSAIRRLIADVNTVMNNSASDDSNLAVSNRQLMMKDRIIQEFDDTETNYRNIARDFAEKIKKLPVPASTNSPNTSFNESSPLLPGSRGPKSGNLQTQMQIQKDQEAIEQTELQYHIMLTEERNRQIEQVAEGIREVNSIFKDLGELVNQQGEQLDTVEENVLQMSGNTQEASRELVKAHEYQKKKSRWSCILLVALTVFMLVMILVVLS